MDKKMVAIVLLFLALFISLAYIELGILSERDKALADEIFLNGSIEGYSIAHLEIYETISQCDLFPVTLSENISYNLIAFECLDLNEQEGGNK